MLRFLAVLGLGFIIFGTGVLDVQAQIPTRQESPAVSVFRYHDLGQPTMQIKVWGAVRTPGAYVVERDIDLLDLLTFAGGPLFQRDNPNVRTSVVVNLSREHDGYLSLIFSTPLDSLTTSNMPIPGLQDGDVLSVDVDVQSRFGWRDGLSIFSAVGTVAVIVLNIMRLSQ